MATDKKDELTDEKLEDVAGGVIKSSSDGEADAGTTTPVKGTNLSEDGMSGRPTRR